MLEGVSGFVSLTSELGEISSCKPVLCSSELRLSLSKLWSFISTV